MCDTGRAWANVSRTADPSPERHAIPTSRALVLRKSSSFSTTNQPFETVLSISTRLK